MASKKIVYLDLLSKEIALWNIFSELIYLLYVCYKDNQNKKKYAVTDCLLCNIRKKWNIIQKWPSLSEEGKVIFL